MRSFNLLAADVNIKELATETKNYSGAELEGLVRAAQSTAMNRHIKVTWLFSNIQRLYDQECCQQEGSIPPEIIVKML